MMTESIRQSGIADAGAVVAWGFRIVLIWLFPPSEGGLSRYYARYSGPDRGFLVYQMAPHHTSLPEHERQIRSFHVRRKRTRPFRCLVRHDWAG